MRTKSFTTFSVVLATIVSAWIFFHSQSPVDQRSSVSILSKSERTSKEGVIASKPAPTAIPDKAARPAEPVAAFANWLNRYRLSPPAERASLLPEGEKLARQRQPAMYSLIAKDPAAALASSINEPNRRLLPDSILSLLEKPVSAKGDLALFNDDGARHRIGRREVYRQAVVGDKSYDAYVYGRRANVLTKYGTSLIGVAMNDRMAVLEEPVRLLRPDDLPAGATLEKPLADAVHPAEEGAPIIQVAGKYFPSASTKQAHEVAARWTAAESQQGPVVQALGQSLPGLSQAAPAVAQASSHLLGAQTALVILTDYSDAQGGPVESTSTATPKPKITSSVIQQRLGVEVADFYTQASYAKTTIGAVTTTGVLRLPKTLATYATNGDTPQLKTDALAAATTAGFHPTDYDRVIVVFADTHGITNNQFDWEGLADVGGSFAWINGTFNLGVVAHELGHNYGLQHAKLWQIDSGKTDPVDPAGSPLDYGDPFDIMGGAIGDAAVQPDPPNPWYLNNLGWLPEAAVQSISADSPQTYRLYRFDHQNASPTHPLALKINRSDGTDYWLAYRGKYKNYPNYSDMGEGAYLFWAKDSTPSSELIDIDTPGTDATDASLNVGKSFTDTQAGITFQVVQSGGTSPDEYLDVKVSMQTRVAFDHKVYDVDEKAGTVNFTVRRLSSSAGPVSVAYSTVPGTAIAGTNYTTASGTLAWVDGDATDRTIAVPILVNPSGTGITTFTIEFGTSSGCVFPNGKVTTVNIEKPAATDSEFIHPMFTGSVNAMALQPDGKVLIGGSFDIAEQIFSPGISRLKPNGAGDSSFNKGPGVSVPSGGTPDMVNVVARQPDGKVIVAGEFTTIRGVSRNRIARLLVDGSLDTGFDPGVGPGNPTAAKNVIKAVAVLPDGKLLVGGSFLSWNGSPHKAMVRLNEDGSLDSSFAKFDGIVTFFTGYEAVNSIALQPAAAASGYAIVAAGSFYRTVGSNAHSGLIRLNADGTRDPGFFNNLAGAFTGAFISSATSVAVQMDGKIVLGGQFNKFNGANASHIVRLKADGSNDITFGTGLTSTQNYIDVLSLIVQPDGAIVAGGYFEKAKDVPQGVARFSSAGVRDTAFFPPIDTSWSGNGVTSMVMAPDNTLLLSFNDAGANPNVIERVFTGVSGFPGVAQFTSAQTSVNEGTTVDLYVERTGGSAGNVSVNYQTVGRSAVSGTSFTAASGTLVWNDGDAAQKKISIPTVLNGTTDPDLVFEVRLAIPMGGLSLGQNGVSTVTIHDTSAGNVPVAEFAQATSAAIEGNVSHTVTVNLSLTHTDPIVVPFTVTGTAVSGPTKDYLITSSTLTFANGVTSQDITVNLKDDNVVEVPKTIILTLKTPISGTAFLGSIKQHTVTITDNDIAPKFTTLPTNAVAAVGDASVAFHSEASGSPAPAYQWLKNGAKITTAGTAKDYSLANIQLTHAAKYSVTATNVFSFATAFAELGVVDATARTVTVTSGNTATLTVTSAGNALSYSWMKGQASPLSGTRVTASGKSLFVKTTTSADAGTYTCTVGNGGTSQVAVTFTLVVVDLTPVITNAVKLDDAIVSGTYHYPITYDPAAHWAPVSFSAGGLPPGLVCNPTTGVISGKPTVKGSVKVTLKATNGRGTTSLTLPLTIADLAPNTTGSYTGMIDRDVGLNLNLGGKITLNVTPTGAYTGTLTLGATGYGILGALNTSTTSSLAGGDTYVTIANKVSAHLTFTIDPSTLHVTTGAVVAGASNVAFTAWRSVVPSALSTGYQTFSLKLDNALANKDAYPQGLGFGWFTVPTTAAAFPVAGVLSDGTSFGVPITSTTTSLGSMGEILVYQCIYGGKGSILGKLVITPGQQNTDCTSAGSLTWCRPAIAGRLYAAGFTPITLTAEGGRIDATKATSVPPGFVDKADNASLSFTLAHVSDNNSVPTSPDVVVTLKKGGGSTFPPLPNRTTFGFTAATGRFAGTFTQTTPARVGTYQGILVNHGGVINGDGWFTLPQALPLPTTSVILSGAVKLEAK